MSTKCFVSESVSFFKSNISIQIFFLIFGVKNEILDKGCYVLSLILLAKAIKMSYQAKDLNELVFYRMKKKILNEII